MLNLVQAVLNSLQLLQEPRAVLNLVQAVLNNLQHLYDQRRRRPAVLNSLLVGVVSDRRPRKQC